MNDAVFKRLLGVLESVSLAGEEGSPKRAEARAYAAAISAAAQRSRAALEEAFVQTAGEKGLLMFCSLLGAEPLDDLEETRKKLAGLLARGAFILGSEEFKQAQEAVPGLKAEYTLMGEHITVDPVTRESLEEFSRLLNDYYPAFRTPDMAGGGLTWDELAGFDFRWYELDLLRLPFYIWERLGAAD